jgi:hypothetical protein
MIGLNLRISFSCLLPNNFCKDLPIFSNILFPI